MRFVRTIALVATALMLPLLAACGGSSAESAQTEAVSGLVAAAVDSVDLSAFGITIAFTDTEVSGMSGVNRYAGGFTSSPEGAMDFGQLVVTAMAGPDDAMQAEQVYLAALDTVTGYSVTDAGLSLYADEQEILVYTQ
jgi:heat shock protein HslJ